MGKEAAEKRPYNRVVRIGMWLTLAAALVWAGGETYKMIQTYVPYALGLGIVVLAAGLAIQFKKVKPTEET
jgi:hypothetical protein